MSFEKTTKNVKPHTRQKKGEGGMGMGMGKTLYDEPKPPAEPNKKKIQMFQIESTEGHIFTKRTERGRICFSCVVVVVVFPIVFFIEASLPQRCPYRFKCRQKKNCSRDSLLLLVVQKTINGREKNKGGLVFASTIAHLPRESCELNRNTFSAVENGYC